MGLQCRLKPAVGRKHNCVSVYKCLSCDRNRARIAAKAGEDSGMEGEWFAGGQRKLPPGCVALSMQTAYSQPAIAPSVPETVFCTLSDVFRVRKASRGVAIAECTQTVEKCKANAAGCLPDLKKHLRAFKFLALHSVLQKSVLGPNLLHCVMNHNDWVGTGLVVASCRGVA